MNSERKIGTVNLFRLAKGLWYGLILSNYYPVWKKVLLVRSRKSPPTDYINDVWVSIKWMAKYRISREVTEMDNWRRFSRVLILGHVNNNKIRQIMNIESTITERYNTR